MAKIIPKPGQSTNRLGWVAALLAAALLVVGGANADEAGGTLINCRIQEGLCTSSIDGRAVTLDIQPRPVRAMEDLVFSVSIDTSEAIGGMPVIDLNMLAMDMGQNRVPLRMRAPGVYEGRGVIVRCRSGIHTWKATVTFPGIGAVDFIFDVVY